MHTVATFLLTVILVMCAAAQADAQVRAVVLNLREGDTELLLREVELVDGVEVQNQRWFLEQVRAAGEEPARILTRPDDLRVVMVGAEIDYVMYVDNEDGPYEGRFLDATGKLVKEVVFGDEFGGEEARQMRDAFEELLGLNAPPPAPIGVVEDLEEESPPVVTPAKPASERAVEGFSLALAGRMFMRDQSFAGANTAMLTYVSALYPGGSLQLAYVTGAQLLGGNFGVWATGDLGFDAIGTSNGQVSIFHLDAGGALTLNYDGLRVGLGARHIQYTVADPNVFPSVAQTVAMIMLRVEHRLGSVLLGGDVEVFPWGMHHGASARLFGEKSSQFGFSGAARIGYAFNESFAVVGEYTFRHLRANFPGNGTLDFNDSIGFELVHGPKIGILWHP